MPTLVPPPRCTPDSVALGKAASRDGWRVERLANWRLPDGFAGGEVVFYGEPLFASVVAVPLGVTLLEPPFDWLPRLPEAYRLRSVRLTTLAGARSDSFPAFVKPADDKCFAAGVYDVPDRLPAPGIVPESTPVLIAEPVAWEVEF